MKVDIEGFVSGYHEADKFKDNWQQGVKLLPFSSNPSTSGFDKLCSLQNTVGEFARLANDDGTQPITEFESSVVEPVKKHLAKNKMSEPQIADFVKVVRDVFFINGNLNIAAPAFFKFIPLVPEVGITDAEKKKYADGQRKMADYIFSMYKGDPIHFGKSGCDNLFLRIVSDALSNAVFAQPNNDSKGNYEIPRYIVESFTSDLTWMLGQTEQVQVRYLHLLFHFYACYSITQSLFLMSSERCHAKDMEDPEEMYFILASEKASMNHDAVLYGWANKIQKCKTLEKLYGKMQAIDIANSILGKRVGYYPQIMSALNETPFEDNKNDLTKVLESYVSEKTAYIHARKSEKHQTVKDFSPEISSYEEFLKKLERCCVELQSVSYIGRFKKKVLDILGIRFLQSRRGNCVLVLDNEMLTFLIALMTRGQKTKLEQLYKRFNSYGIYFNRGTRSAIEEYLLKLNLLDRKSDSGEVQYVRPVL